MSTKLLPSEDGVTATIEVVTPDQAEVYLSSYPENRKLRSSVVDAYARDMSNDEWRLTGDSIKFSKSNKMIDGQHRCWASVTAKLPFTTLVVRGLEDEDVKLLDTGIPRKASDVLHFEGKKNTTVLSAAIHTGIQYDRGIIKDSMSMRTGGGTYRYTRPEELAWLEENPDLEDVVNTYAGPGRKIKFPPGPFCYGMLILHRLDPVAAQTFVISMVNKQTEGVGDPRLALSNYLDDNSSVRKGSGEVLWVLFDSWNKWRKQVPEKRVRPFQGQGENRIGRALPKPI